MTEEQTLEAAAEPTEGPNPSWGKSAPRGGRTVMSRLLRQGTRVPLFLGQTLVQSLRDVGYNDTTSALCEHVDNSIQGGADEIRVYFNQKGKRGSLEVDCLVYDNGRGMDPQTLQVAMSFGGSMHFQDRGGIGRFGVGMKTAALSMSPTLSVYSWQEPAAIYNMVLDVNEIGRSMSNLVELPEPDFLDEFPSDVARILTRPMAHPKNVDPLAKSENTLIDELDSTGTIVFMPDCDRLQYKTARALADSAMKEMARIYRRQIKDGLGLYINNRRLTAIDPTCWDEGAYHASVEGITEKRSKLIRSWPKIEIPVSENSDKKAYASARLYMLPIEDWYDLPRSKLTKQLGMFEGRTVSVLRNDRELYLGHLKELVGRRHGDNEWLRVQIDITGELDEAFGVAMNKQGIRPKDYVLKILQKELSEDITSVRAATKDYRAKRRVAIANGKPSDGEQRATKSDAFQRHALEGPLPLTQEELEEYEQDLRKLATQFKRADETDQQAYERINSSRYIIATVHDEYWPFYHVETALGKVILKLNSAHPFYEQLYQPLAEIAASGQMPDADESSIDAGSVLTSLQLLLLSLARAQSVMVSAEGVNGSRGQTFEDLRREWSDTYKRQLAT